MTLQLLSHAKLNWYLRVFEPRADGYHDLDTIFQELEIADELTFTGTDEPRCEIEGFPSDVPNETNLITRAWGLLREAHPVQVKGLHCSAVKRLPRGGGLGGGSSNAAATLKAIDTLYELRLPLEQLENYAARLGSDVPFFIRGGCAHGSGRGEKLRVIESIKQFHFVLLLPPGGVSTREAFARLDALDRSAMHYPENYRTQTENALISGAVRDLAPLLFNDFELAVADESWFVEGCDSLLRAGCKKAFLCGSGSTIAGLAENEQDALAIEQRIRKLCPYTSICTKSLTP